MSVLKTKPTNVSVERHIAAIANEERRKDAQRLVVLMRKVTIGSRHEKSLSASCRGQRLTLLCTGPGRRARADRQPFVHVRPVSDCMRISQSSVTRVNEMLLSLIDQRYFPLAAQL